MKEDKAGDAAAPRRGGRTLDEATLAAMEELQAEADASAFDVDRLLGQVARERWVATSLECLAAARRGLEGHAAAEGLPAATDAVHARPADAPSAQAVREAFERDPVVPPVAASVVAAARLAASGAGAAAGDGDDLTPEWRAISDAEYAAEYAAFKVAEARALATGAVLTELAPMNPKQRAAGRLVLPWFLRRLRGVDPGPAPLEFVHGAPGTGKSAFVARLGDTMAALGLGVVLYAAPTGVAAMLLPNGRTMHNLGGLNMFQAKSNSEVGPPSAKAVLRVATMAGGNVANVGLIAVDELSAVAPLAKVGPPLKF